MSSMNRTENNSGQVSILEKRAQRDQQLPRNAFRVSLITAVALLIASVADVLATYQNPDGQFYSTAIMLTVAFAAAVSAVLCRRGQSVQGIMILTGGLILACLAFPFINDQVSVQVGIIVTVLAFGIATNTVPTRNVPMIIVPTIVAAMAGMLMDYYLPIEAPASNMRLTNGIAAFLVILYVILLARRFQFFPLQGKLIMSFLLVGLLPLALLAWLNNWQAAQKLESDTQLALTATAQQNSSRIDDFIRSELDDVRLNAQLPAVVKYLSLGEAERAGSSEAGEAFLILSNLGRKDPIFLTSYALLGMDGVNLMDTVTDNPGQDESGYEYFSRPLETGLPTLSPVLFVDGSPSLYFSSPVRGGDGQITGVLRVAYNASVLQSLLVGGGESEGPGKYSVLVDDAYFIRLAHSQSPQLLYKTYAEVTPDRFLSLQAEGRIPAGAMNLWVTHQQTLVDAVRNIKNEPYFTTSGQAIGGEDALTTAVHLELAPWLVLTRQSMAAVQAPIVSQTRSAILLALAAVVLVFGAAVVVSRVIAAPLVRLTAVAEQVAAGDLETRADIISEDEIGTLSNTLNTMTAQLQDTLRGLELRVADRTRALELSSDVSRRLSTILDPAELVREVVELLKATFDYYHVHIYLYDEHKETLVMVGGTGEAGKALLESGHKLPHGRGLVGRACESGSEVLVADTDSDPNWLPNPLLPDTRCEIAVPIMAGNDVLGALDVQQNRVNGLDRQDADLLRGIASQVAIALQNANRFVETQRRAEREMLVAGIVQQIQDTRSIPDALQVAAREVGRALKAPRTRAGIRLAADKQNHHGDHSEQDN